jgi:hypothetical protein
MSETINNIPLVSLVETSNVPLADNPVVMPTEPTIVVVPEPTYVSVPEPSPSPTVKDSMGLASMELLPP